MLLVGSGAVLWAQGIEKTDYRPQSLFIGTSNILAYTRDSAGKDLSVLDGALATDVFGPGTAEFQEDDMQKCFAVLRKAGVAVQDPGTAKEGEPDGTAEKRLPIHVVVRSDRHEGREGPQLRHLPERWGHARRHQLPGAPDPYHFGGPPHGRRRPRRLCVPYGTPRRKTSSSTRADPPSAGPRADRHDRSELNN